MSPDGYGHESAYVADDRSSTIIPMRPCVKIAETEMNSLRRTQRNHKALVSGHEPKTKNSDGTQDPSQLSFPSGCLVFMRLLPGNACCLDCGVGAKADLSTESSSGGGSSVGAGGPIFPMWASVALGTVLCDACAFVHITKAEKVRNVQPCLMRSSLHLTVSCVTFSDKDLREDISPTLDINTFIFSKDVFALINKHCMNL